MPVKPQSNEPVMINDAPQAAPVEPVEIQGDDIKELLANERTPSDWDISNLSGKQEGLIRARSGQSGRVYVGTMEGFNTLLRS